MGGTNDFGESPEETLLRETKEEANLDIKINYLVPDCSSQDWFNKKYLQHTILVCYSCSLINGELKDSDHKINDLKWVNRYQTQDYDLIPNVKEFLKTYNNIELKK